MDEIGAKSSGELYVCCDGQGEASTVTDVGDSAGELAVGRCRGPLQLFGAGAYESCEAG